MSMPNIPNVDSEINITREDALNLIVASIGFEELGLAHLINAEAEKVQFALGTLETAESAQDIETIMEINTSVDKVLKDVIKKELLLAMKFEDAIDAINNLPVTPVPATSKFVAE